jgi:hypothetical protein
MIRHPIKLGAMRSWRWIAMVGAGALALAASCGDDSETATSPSTTTTASSGGAGGQGGSGGATQTGGGGQAQACPDFCSDRGASDDCAICLNDLCETALLACEADPMGSGCDGCSDWLGVLSLDLTALCPGAQTLAQSLITCACGDVAAAGKCN